MLYSSLWTAQRVEVVVERGYRSTRGEGAQDNFQTPAPAWNTCPTPEDVARQDAEAAKLIDWTMMLKPTVLPTQFPSSVQVGALLRLEESIGPATCVLARQVRSRKVLIQKEKSTEEIVHKGIFPETKFPK
eukprot:297654-Amphidinium_carterae.1